MLGEDFDWCPLLGAQVVEPALVLPEDPGNKLGKELEDDHDEERGSEPIGGAWEERIGRSMPPIKVVVPHCHGSTPSVIFLLAADIAASKRDPAPRTEFTASILFSKYLPYQTISIRSNHQTSPNIAISQYNLYIASITFITLIKHQNSKHHKS